MFQVFLVVFCSNLILPTTSFKNKLSAELIHELLSQIFDEENLESDVKPFDLAVKLKPDYEDDLVSDLFATSYNLEKVARVREFNEHNSLFQFQMKHMQAAGNTKRHKRSVLQDTIEVIQSDDRVEFVVPQPYLKREKRSVPLDYHDLDQELKRIFLGERPKPFQIDHDLNFNDLDFNKEWYLINKGQLNTPVGHDLNIKDAWLKGYTGKNVTIVIIDDGLDHRHPDIKPNYVSPTSGCTFENYKYWRSMQFRNQSTATIIMMKTTWTTIQCRPQWTIKISE
jgi:hypothetical protein